jgi:hypothetical protein
MLQFYGQPGRIIIEIDGKDGSRVQVPLEEHELIVINSEGSSYGELRIPFRGKFIERILDAADEREFRTGLEVL